MFQWRSFTNFFSTNSVKLFVKNKTPEILFWCRIFLFENVFFILNHQWVTYSRYKKADVFSLSLFWKGIGVKQTEQVLIFLIWVHHKKSFKYFSWREMRLPHLFPILFLNLPKKCKIFSKVAYNVSSHD